MCGICGFIGLNDLALLKKMSKLQRHRGPDNEGFYIDKNVSLASQRLSIIDVLGGNQPIFNEDKSIVVVFNGEIFNFRELRWELEKKGHEFSTKSDTETIVHAYEEFGSNFFEKLNGQFAFALFDSEKKKVFLARDRFGIKPLFYSECGNSFFFSSEMKPLTIIPDFKKTMDWNALKDYFSIGCILSPKTIFSGIKQVLPGHFLQINGRGFSEKKFFDFSYNSANQFEGEKKAVYSVEKLLRESVERQLVSDVPVGVFLSGGIDSSAVTYFATKKSAGINTFSAGFEEEKYNELPKAKLVAEKFGTNHHEIIVTEKDFDNFPSLMEKFGEPFIDSSAIPTNAVSALAAKKVKVVLSGEGGDELFAGYPKFEKMALSRNFSPIARVLKKSIPKQCSSAVQKKFPRLHRKGKRFFDYCTLEPFEQYLGAHKNFSEEEIKFLFKKSEFGEKYRPKNALSEYSRNVSPVEKLNSVLFLDLKMYLAEDILVKIDRMSMNNSLESRVPFLDNFLAEYCTTIPFNYKLRFGEKKFILKKALKGKLPKKILSAKKQGFGIPLPEWVSGPVNERIKSLFFEKNSQMKNFFNIGEVEKIISPDSGRFNAAKSWALLSFAVWHKIFMEETRPEKVFG